MIEVEIIFIDAVYGEKGGFDKGKNPMREESLMRPTPIF